MTLYLGATRRQCPSHSVRGLLRYQDRVVDAPFDEPTYLWLCSLIPEFCRTRPRI
jgi:hypothetical protein